MPKKPEISFIIPALNEEQNIQHTISSIKKAAGSHTHEVIVSDNGSDDRTTEIARAAGAIVIVNEAATIAGLRNAGAKLASGSVLVFIDADVQLAEDWLQNLKQEMEGWPQDNLIVTGSTCLVPPGPSFVQINWFAKLTKTGTNYINSGHLVVSREMFDRTGGFDEKLKTAEDYDFCQRAKSKGAKLEKAPNLKAYHYGYPITLRAFCSREAWHGREDCSNLKKFIRSRTALASTANSLLLSSSLVAFALTQKTILPAIFLFSSLSFCFLLSWKKFGKDSLKNMIKTSICFELYLLSRTSSLFYKKHRSPRRDKCLSKQTFYRPKKIKKSNKNYCN